MKKSAIIKQINMVFMIALPTIAYMSSLYVKQQYLAIIIIAITHNIANLIGYLTGIYKYEEK